ncbi:hypothetical protein [Bradyrhizobium sp. USDA 3650]
MAKVGALLYSARHLRSPHNARELILQGPSKEPLDLVEMPREISVLRSRHSENGRVTNLLNKLMIKVAHLMEPENAAHAEQLRKAYERTMAEVERAVAHNERKPSR